MSALVLYGDFNCPWSYLAHRRARVLARAGVAVDWRAVEHAPRIPSRNSSRPPVQELQAELERVVAMLLPGEELPYDLAGFVPPTRAAVAAYAEGYAATVGPLTATVLLESFWMHGIDIGDPKVLRTVLVDAIRSGTSSSEILAQWGYAVDITGGPVTALGWRLVSRWAREWRATGKQVVPVLLGAEDPVFGVDAVEWLGREISRRGLDPAPFPAEEVSRAAHGELPSLTWISENGGRWLRHSQDAPASSRRSLLRAG